MQLRSLRVGVRGGTEGNLIAFSQAGENNLNKTKNIYLQRKHTIIKHSLTQTNTC